VNLAEKMLIDDVHSINELHKVATLLLGGLEAAYFYLRILPT